MRTRFNLFTLLVLMLSIENVKAQSTQNGNAADSIHHPFQISFMPFLGTDGMRSRQITYDLSINILAGTVKNVKSCEVGGLLNMVRGNAGACQLAGIGNLVGGTTTGFQGAGTFNISQKLQGIQASGMINVAGQASGIQIAGLVNHATKGKCIQIGGMVNNTSESTVFQISGLINNAPVVDGFQAAGWINNASNGGQFQIAGLVNNCRDETGFQIAGLANNASNIRNLQIAGLVNNVKQINGIQISGLVNYAQKVKGVQIGFINIADTCPGVPIGVFSFVRNGYHKLEISGDELFYTNLAFRSGVKKLHSIIMAGIKPDNFGTPLWTYGFGLGSSISISEKTSLDIDAVFQNVIKEDHIGNNYLDRLSVGIDRQCWTKTSIYIGAVYNFLITDTRYSHYSENYSSLAPYKLTNNATHGGFNLKTWIGFKVGIRFF